MFQALNFSPIDLPPAAEALRGEVRAFLEEEAAAGTFFPNADFGSGFDPAFSRKLGERGWIGMTWPKKYGGGERSYLERYVVTEELVASGAPVGGQWTADRQSGPLLLRFGAEAQRETILPGITRGEIFFSIGMSEPDSGSDLASIRTRAEKVDGGWQVNGTKIWTSGAHRNHYMITLVRTAPQSEDRHAGMSQLIVDLKAEGIEVRPILNLSGEHGFNEVVFKDVFVPDGMVVGEVGQGWSQVMSELGYERSGPERFLSGFRVLVELIRAVGEAPDRRAAEVIGRAVAHLVTLRGLSISVAGMLERGDTLNVEAAVVKDLGATHEQELAEIVRLVAEAEPSPEAEDRLARALGETFLHAPSFSIRGGTREILRGVIARGLGLR